MATENSSYDPLRNPQVDFDRTDLSPRGILLFLIGLLLCGVFIELVVWGMFRFMAKSDVLFPQAQTNPMASFATSAAAVNFALDIPERSRSQPRSFSRAATAGE